MKPTRIWIVIALILLVGTGTTSYVRQLTFHTRETETEQTGAAETVGAAAAAAAPRAFSASDSQPLMAAEVKSGQQPAAGEAAADQAVSETGNQEERTPVSRLEELDAEIQKSRAQNQDTTTNSLKASADGERKVWEAELDQLVAALEERLSGEELQQFRKEQNDWTRQRESIALRAMEGNAGSALQELEYNRSLAETTRDRAFELARQYEDILSETE